MRGRVSFDIEINLSGGTQEQAANMMAELTSRVLSSVGGVAGATISFNQNISTPESEGTEPEGVEVHEGEIVTND